MSGSRAAAKTAKSIKHGDGKSGRTPPAAPSPMKPITLRDYKERLLRVLVYLQQYLDEPLSLDVLAARACLSPHHFHRVFTGMIGESLHNHIRRLRLERAAARLSPATCLF
jgi:transcriptional regulator GlxA family with amidase domain